MQKSACRRFSEGGNRKAQGQAKAEVQKHKVQRKQNVIRLKGLAEAEAKQNCRGV